ncbi:MAG: glycoside hydrolase family 2 protein [Acidobacteria bacterium]|nr:glycoside hydrolase family 2 protein [Acidobacteriota bacterium]
MNRLIALLFLGCIALKVASASADTPTAFARVRDGSTPAALIDLGGKWQFKATDQSEWLDARVPGTVHTDLIRYGKLEDPFYRDNELKAQWVEDREWEYRRSFQVSRGFLDHHRIFLECRGLDTIAEVRLNDTLVAGTANMFIEYEFDVKPLLREGRNELHIVFRSIVSWIQRQKAADHKASVLCPQGHPDNDCRKGLLFFARKEASDFGWDWSPRTVTCGIWKPIRLAAYKSGRIADMSFRLGRLNHSEALLDVLTGIEQFGGGDLTLQVQIMLEDRIVADASRRVTDRQVRLSLLIRTPRLWWPNGWGQHPLYHVRGTLRDTKQIVHSRTYRIGFRTVELVREPDERGEHFGFRVNGHLIFCKGANWIPLDALPDRVTIEHVHSVLRAAVEANMNMLRVWGGGLYESDAFYDYCDENGIMIWHDFMFASGPYIANAGYLENVRREIENVVRRRRHHPSIVLWCGNNEQESSMAGGLSWLEKYETVTWADYDRIFHEVIPETVSLHDPDRPYWPSSPHHPLDRERKNADWETASGDAHDWGVWHEGRSFDWFNELHRFRFVSEFGFESLPHMETIRGFTLPADRCLNSYVLEHHEKTGLMTREWMRSWGHNRGISRIVRYAASLFGMAATLEEWVYVSQVMQGEGLRLAGEALRRNFPGSTGALHWQLGDNWPAISCSSIDYGGRWKASHYMARRFFGPVLLCSRLEGASVRFWGINDGLAEKRARLEWGLARFDGKEVRRGEAKITLRANQSRPIAEISFAADVSEDTGLRTYRNESFSNSGKYYLWYRLMSNGEELSSNVAFFAPHKYLQLQHPGFKTQVSRDQGRLIVTLSAQRFAAFVELGLKNGYVRFSDNYFHLLPGAPRRIEVVEPNITESELRGQLYLRSLADLLPQGR